MLDEAAMPGYGLSDCAPGAVYLNGLWEEIERRADRHAKTVITGVTAHSCGVHSNENFHLYSDIFLYCKNPKDIVDYP